MNRSEQPTKNANAKYKQMVMPFYSQYQKNNYKKTRKTHNKHTPQAMEPHALCDYVLRKTWALTEPEQLHLVNAF